ncbi:S8 family serine peptidase [Croceicoccus sp. 1NDH52]|nr:S8 family serine peptidase [Croceicoccus gelatinilyticus]
MPAAAKPTEERGAKPIANQYICVFHKGAVSKNLVKVAAEGAVRGNGGRVMHTYKNTIRGFSTYMPAQAVERMKAKNPGIAYCEQDQVFSLGPIEVTPMAPPPGKGPGGGGGDGGGDTTLTHDDGDAETPYGIDRVHGGEAYTGNHVAYVIDSGIDLDHPDLNVDVAKSRDFTGENNGGEDTNGHGTHVAGTIAAKKDGTGVAGVAAGAKVIAVRVLDSSGSGSYSAVIAGVDYAGQGNAGDVANMSLGGGFSQVLNDAVIAASENGILFALAAGNERADTSRKSPASAEGPNIYTIAAIDDADGWASFSNYGLEVDFAEPGVAIASTYLGGQYASMSGTSMASPHAAGILLWGEGITAEGGVTRRKDSYSIGILGSGPAPHN